MDGLNGRHQFQGRGIFQHVAARPGRDDPLGVFAALVGGERQHSGRRHQFANGHRRFESAEPRHIDVHEDDVGPQRLGLGDGFVAVGGFPHDL